MTSNKVKQMISCKDGWDKVIKKGEPITINHITSLVLYTDLSEYCTHFSSTFRQCCRHETLESLKKRNGNYWWQSKFIREAVECYGYDAYNEEVEYGYNQERGPFYSCIDVIVSVGEFGMRLRAPTSTTKGIGVAINFSKESGIIIALNNNGYMFADLVPFIDASWFSRYPDEV